MSRTTSTIEPQVTTFPGTSPPSLLLTALRSHLPYSLNVLRRLQFASRVEGGSSSSAYIISVSSPDTPHFCAAYYDPSRGPETECWVYSTLEDAVPFNRDPESFAFIAPNLPENEVKICVEQLILLFRRLAAIEAEFTSNCKERGLPADTYRQPGAVRIGACHETIRRLLISVGVRIRSTGVVPKGKDWEFYAKWLVKVDEVTKATEGDKAKGLEEGMRWDTVRREDTDLIKSRTSIPKRQDTLVVLPSSVLRLEDGTPIAWVFLGLDGSLSTLHVEEPYRGRGLAKTITRHLLRHHTSDFGDDGWGSTDISTTNLQSQGVFKSIGGKPAWTVSWFYLDLASVGDPIETLSGP